MATLATENRVIDGKKVKIFKVYFYRDGVRDRIFLGRMLNKANAAKFCSIVHELEQASLLGQDPDADLRRKLDSLSPTLLSKLIDRGLAKSRTRKTLEQLFDSYLRQYTNANTLKEWRSLQLNCTRFFGADRVLGTITQEHCRQFVFEFLRTLDYAPPTIEKRLKNLKQLMRHAVEQEWIAASPVQKVKFTISKEQKVANKPYIPPDLIALACESMPNEEWACYLAWLRWLGARASEPLSDEWKHVDFARKSVSRYDNKKRRRIRVPLAKELVPYLVALKAATEAAGNPLSGSIFPAVKAHKHPWVFVRRQLVQAGIEPWKCLFTSLRASRSRELIRLYSPAVEAALIGHSSDIALMHYDDVLDSDLRGITGEEPAPTSTSTALMRVAKTA
jgi:integrase